MSQTQIEEIMEAIEKTIINSTGRVDVILLPHDHEGKSGQFFVVYTVEYADTYNVSSVKLFEGTYTVVGDTLTLIVNGQSINVKL